MLVQSPNNSICTILFFIAIEVSAFRSYINDNNDTLHKKYRHLKHARQGIVSSASQKNFILFIKIPGKIYVLPTPGTIYLPCSGFFGAMKPQILYTKNICGKSAINVCENLKLVTRSSSQSPFDFILASRENISTSKSIQFDI